MSVKINAKLVVPWTGNISSDNSFILDFSDMANNIIKISAGENKESSDKVHVIKFKGDTPTQEESSQGIVGEAYLKVIQKYKDVVKSTIITE